MPDEQLKASYWRRTRRLAILAGLLIIVITAILPLLAPLVNDTRFLRFPLGFFLAMHVGVVGAVIVVYWFLAAQDKTDRRYNMTIQI